MIKGDRVMDNKNNTTSGGIGFTGLLTIVFVVLKLLNVIKWSWWWVLSPIWISFGIALVVIFIPIVAAIVGNKK